jgi:hypothetical protein
VVRSATSAFNEWMKSAIAPIAHSHGFKGQGPAFRKRVGDDWIVFAIERRRLDPQEAAARTTDPRVEFRLIVGINISATRRAWDEREGDAPALWDLNVHAPSLALWPEDGEQWHVFDTEDVDSQTRLTELIRVGLGESLEALGRADARRVLDLKLAYCGPLRDLAPGQAEELLALAAEAGDTDLRARIIAALKEDLVREPWEDERQRLTAEAQEMFGPSAEVHVMTPPRDDEILEPWKAGRRLSKTKEKLLAELASDRRYARRNAASRLGGWDRDPDVVLGLREALSNPDAFTRLVAANSLGHVADPDAETWRKVLALAAEADAGPSELGESIVLLARLDLESRTNDAVAALERMVELYPAWTRRLRALAALARAQGSTPD